MLASDPLDDYQPLGAFGQPVLYELRAVRATIAQSWERGTPTTSRAPIATRRTSGFTGSLRLPARRRWVRGADALPPNPAQAVEWCRQAAEAGIAEAQYRLDILLKSGETDTPNGLELGVSWLRKAAEQGHL